MEYGWNLVSASNELASLETVSERNSREEDMAEMSSIRSGRSGTSIKSPLSPSRFNYRGFVSNSFTTAPGTSALRAGLTGGFGDKIRISDWKVPNAPTGESNLSEDAQLESLKRYSAVTKVELARHNGLRNDMLQIVCLSVRQILDVSELIFFFRI